MEVTKGCASWEVVRRYSDFRRLREQLKQEGAVFLLSDRHVCNFPAKSRGRLSNEQVEERRVKLERFLQALLVGCRSWVPKSTGQRVLHEFLEVGTSGSAVRKPSRS